MEGVVFSGLQFYNIDCLKAFRAIFGFKADFVTFGKGFISVALDRGVVDEDIAAVGTCDEAKPFAVIKPFYSSLVH